MAHRPIPFSTPNSSVSAASPFYKEQRAKHGKAVSKGMKRAREAREAAKDAESKSEDLAEAVVAKRRR